MTQGVQHVQSLEAMHQPATAGGPYLELCGDMWRACGLQSCFAGHGANTDLDPLCDLEKW